MDIITILPLLLCIEVVRGHGRMIEPPMRSSMWRYGFQTPKNYNDNELNCGGFAKMMESGGRCGPCGDPWFSPKDNEAGGIYATGTIARYYAVGQVINVTVELTSNHNGYFEFRLCPNNNPSKPVTQECLNRNVLNIMGYGKRYNIDTKDANLFMEFQLSLPPGLTCSQCVLQWKWRAAQNRGSDGKGGECFGCGPQEHFINCADVAIGTRTNPLPLNRPGHVGVYMSKTGPKTNVVHTPSSTEAKPTKSLPATSYDPSVMEPPVQSYSQVNPSSSSKNLQSNSQVHHSSTSNNYQNEMYADNSRKSNANYNERNMDNSRTSNANYNERNMDSSRTWNNKQSYQNQQSTSNAVRNEVPTISKHSSYTSMLDSKNEITAMVLQYISSLPMENAMESGLVECDGYIRPICKAIPMWNNNRPFDEWCTMLCPTGVCPAAVCSCTCNKGSSSTQHQSHFNYKSTPPIKCRSMTAWGDASMDQWCTATCSSNPDNCPSDHCHCDGL